MRSAIVLLTASLVACAGRTTNAANGEDAGVADGAADDVDAVDSMDDVDLDASPPPPPDPEGTIGLVVGDVIPNAKVTGVRGDDPTATSETISLWDFHDPDGSRGITGIYAPIEAMWCGPCGVLADQIARWSPIYEAHGAVIIDVLVESKTFPNPASEADIATWLKLHHESIFVGLDPDKLLVPGGTYAFPHAYAIDPRTMKIVRVVEGIDDAIKLGCTSNTDCCDPTASALCTVHYECSATYDSCLHPGRKDPLDALGALMRVNGSDLPFAFP